MKISTFVFGVIAVTASPCIFATDNTPGPTDPSSSAPTAKARKSASQRKLQTEKALEKKVSDIIEAAVYDYGDTDLAARTAVSEINQHVAGAFAEVIESNKARIRVDVRFKTGTTKPYFIHYDRSLD